ESLMKRDDPAALLFRTRLSTLYPEQTIGRTIFDEELNLENISRKTLVNYKQRVYNNKNFVLSVSGNITAKLALNLTEKYFSSFPQGEISIFETPVFSKFRNVVHTEKDLKQAKLSLSYEGFRSNTKEIIELRLLNIILGAGFSSRLYEELRNKLKLIYSINCTRESFSDSGYTHITTFLNQDKISNALEVIKVELEKLLRFGVSADELKRAKNICLSHILFNMDSASQRAYYYGEQVALGIPILNLTNHINMIQNTTITNIANISKQVFTQRPIINIISSSDPKIVW
ncbi:MAG: pitrilysin family protein, partial [Candidatus Amesbacteria bacterium]|nr:pitrilysin family protein [Candidatus Amesbacteria bacterium]